MGSWRSGVERSVPQITYATKSNRYASIRFLFLIRVVNPALAGECRCQKKQQFCDFDHKHLRMNGLPVTRWANEMRAGGSNAIRAIYSSSRSTYFVRW